MSKCFKNVLLTCRKLALAAFYRELWFPRCMLILIARYVGLAAVWRFCFLVEVWRSVDLMIVPTSHLCKPPSCLMCMCALCIFCSWNSKCRHYFFNIIFIKKILSLKKQFFLTISYLQLLHLNNIFGIISVDIN